MQELKVEETKQPEDDLPEYTEEVGRDGMFNALPGDTLELLYYNVLKLVAKIENKWLKRRLLQIGMFQDMINSWGITAAYVRALQTRIGVLESQVDALKQKIPVIEEEPKEEALAA